MKKADAEQIAMLVEARNMPLSETRESPPPFRTPVPATRRVLTAEERATFDRDGYLVVRQWLSAAEVSALAGCLEADPLIKGTRDDGSLGRNISVSDAEGRDTKLTLWWFLGDDTYGQFGRSASLVRQAGHRGPF